MTRHATLERIRDHYDGAAQAALDRDRRTVRPGPEREFREAARAFAAMWVPVVGPLALLNRFGADLGPLVSPEPKRGRSEAEAVFGGGRG